MSENTNRPFISRHIGPNQEEQKQMLSALGYSDLDKFINAVVPAEIRVDPKVFDSAKDKASNDPVREDLILAKLKEIASTNKIFKSYIGLGYYNCLVPEVIKRNILENPLWYTQYTPYQAEISQGRLEALLNFQTLICELCALPVANASLLDEGTAAAEATMMAYSFARASAEGKNVIHVSEDVFPQTLDLIKTRAAPVGIEVRVEKDLSKAVGDSSFAIFIQYPAASGNIPELTQSIAAAKAKNCTVIAATDLMALQLLKAPGEIGADIAIGNSQRFGVPLGYGGPHAAFIACHDQYKRLLPGRIIGVSKDTQGQDALRLALQTREQHIRREKATSNICTAQVLLAVMASMYAVYHGPKGLKNIASDLHRKTCSLAAALKKNSIKVLNSSFFDTITIAIEPSALSQLKSKAESQGINLGCAGTDKVRIALDETTTYQDLNQLLKLFTGSDSKLDGDDSSAIETSWRRESKPLQQKVFNSYHSETELLRYINKLQSKDLSLAVSMIPLGSCTMKLNATSELVPVSWAEFANLHPFAPLEQSAGYRQMFSDLENWLNLLTGFSAASLQPNSGAQGEYAGLLSIRRYHLSRSDKDRNICLIPKSAHGTNAATAAMVGFEVVAITCDDSGNVDIEEIKTRCAELGPKVAALMITYPSTHGVFEEGIKEACKAVHAAGGQVYLDGANLNALVGLVRPFDIGADVCHSNIHKTFCIPHGGGGPGVGPIMVAPHLKDFLPGHIWTSEDKDNTGAVCAAPWGSAGILPIPWVYMNLMGIEGLKQATEIAILNANYVASRLKDHYPILYVGKNGHVAHECIVDLRAIEKSAGIKVEDVAKRLMDYGYHAPTISWPVPGTMMIEPTESESKQELDRFCDALISIRNEIRQIEAGQLDKSDNPLKNAPHTAQMVCADEWKHSYSRELAAYPDKWSREFKFWPAVGRVDSAYGDRNFVCSCS